MKVVIVLNTAWNAYNFRGLIIRNLLEKGARVTLISPYDDFVSKLENWGVKHLPLPMDAGGVNPINDLRYLNQLKSLLGAEKPDIILSYTIKPNIYGALAARKLRIPIICNVSGLGTTFLWKGWVKLVAKTLYRRAFKNADFIFFQNSDDRELMTESLNISEVNTGLVPGSGIDLQKFKPSENPKEPFTFLMISRLLIDKGVTEFIAASKQVKLKYPDCTIRLVGAYDASHKRSILPEDFETIKKGRDIEYVGQSDDVRPMIQNAHCVVLPSYREGTPRTLLEGAAMGKPLIASDVPGCREVVDDAVNGYLCQSQEAHSLATSMIKMMEISSGDREKMGKASRKLAEEKFDEEIIWAQYWKKITELVSP